MRPQDARKLITAADCGEAMSTERFFCMKIGICGAVYFSQNNLLQPYIMILLRSLNTTVFKNTC